MNGVLEVTVVGKLAFDAKPAAAVLPVGHTHPPASYLGGSGLRGEGHVFLQGAEFLLCPSPERVGEHTAVGGGVQGRRRQPVSCRRAYRGRWRRR